MNSWKLLPLRSIFFFYLAMIIYSTVTAAKLSSQEKQQLLDTHNYHRAMEGAANMKRLDWDVSLEEAAQSAADSCDPVRERGMNIFYNMTVLPQDSQAVFFQVLENWLSNGNENVLQPLLWFRTCRVGCAVADCDRLPLESGNKVFRTRVFICKYAPTYFTSENSELYIQGPCTTRSCSTEANMCVPFTGSVPNGVGGSYCGSDQANPKVPDDPVVQPVTRSLGDIEPSSGSIAGGNNIILTGVGFSSNQFEGSNVVIFESTNGNITCDVISYRSSREKIECVTREALRKDGDSIFTVVVYSNDGSGFERITCSNCNFWYRTSSAEVSTLRNLNPLASSPGTPVTFIGDFHAVGFEDGDNLDNPDSPDTDDERDDYFTRILIGGQGCNPMRENGSMYGSSIVPGGVESAIECMPEMVVSVIDSHNVTAILGRRGTAYVSLGDHLVGLDNNLRPYHFQTHADILEVTPRVGSAEGGTRISITVTNSLLDYKDAVKVYVGGLPCMDVEVITGTYSNDSGVIECTTGYRPSVSRYYPGGRGVSREVWTDSANIDTLRSLPRSENQEIHERLYANSRFPSFSLEYGQVVLRLRYSGFFVPPLTSLYTFNLRSDDIAYFYLSPNASSDHATEREIFNLHHTSFRWNFRSFQYSRPILLEADQPYNFEVLSNNYVGPWDIGLGVKVHNSTLIGGLYEGDYEEQRISISSQAINEEHNISLEVLPLVRRVSIWPVTVLVGSGDINTTQLEDSDSCLVTVNITTSEGFSDAIHISPFSSASDVESLLNEVSSIQNMGGVAVTKTSTGISDQTFGSGDTPVEFIVTYLVPIGGDLQTLPVLSIESVVLISCGLSGQDVRGEVDTLQESSYPNTFNAGFSISSQLTRLTRPLPLNTSAVMLRDELTELLSWGCDIDERIAEKSSFYLDYETQGGGNRDNSTSFCGSYSDRNPGTVAGVEEYRVLQRPYVCFAYRYSRGDDSPGLLMSVSYRRLNASADGRTTTIFQESRTIELKWSNCNNWPFSQSNDWSDYGCINVRECLNKILPPSELVSYDTYTVAANSVRFRWRSDLYVDNFAIAGSPIEISRVDNLPPAQPNGVVINYIEVEKETLTRPLLYNRGDQHIMVLSNYRVSYSVHDCGAGMGLLTGSYDDTNKTALRVTRIQSASEASSGLYHISIGGKYLRDINATVTGDDLKQLLNIGFSEEGEFDVSRSGSCTGYSWDVKWATKSGDQPLLQVNGSDLIGPEIEIDVATLTDGGTWIRPLRGDMLRTPETEPQVEVVINKIPSSCSNKNCSFIFEDEITPRIASLAPTEGQYGTSVNISGSGFPENSQDISVMIGGAACSVTSVSEDTVQCSVGMQSAGCYQIEIMVAGIGMARNDSLCFRYLLTVDSVSPDVGGVSGGQVITITGEGFLEFSNIPREELGSPFSYLPWFLYGFGVPSMMDSYSILNDTPHDIPEDFNFRSFLWALYSTFPSSVYIGNNPCIITQSNFTELRCVPIISNTSGAANVTVMVADQVAVLEEEFMITTEATVTVDSVDPMTSGVTGGADLLITGTMFGSEADPINVMIGMSPCNVQSHNNTHIQCTTSQHKPGLEPILISAQNGIGISTSVVLNWNGSENYVSPFPIFDYALEVTSISISGGSVFGGTEISITGGFFVEGETTVLIRGEEASLTSVMAREVVFVTPSSSKNHVSTLSAQLLARSGVSYVFEWNRNEFQIIVGDSITWNWELNLNTAQELKVSLYETDLASTKVSGGRSNENREAESVTFQFDRVGTYYFISEITQTTTNTIMIVVEVSEPMEMVREIEVFVGRYLASYQPQGSGSGMNLRRKREAEDMLSPEEEDIVGEMLSFMYSPSYTPTVYSVEPQIGTRLSTTFTIRGELLGTIPTITFGGFPCVVQNANETTITCQLSNDSSLSPPARTSLSLSLINNDPGFGNAYIPAPESTSITLIPLILEISPSEGSTEGGTDIIIRGDTFTSTSPLGVTLGGNSGECVVNTYSEIECTTEPGVDGEMVSIEFYTGSEETVNVMCNNETSDCYFRYSNDRTPMVEIVSPTTIREVEGGVSKIEIWGQGFSEYPAYNNISLGGNSCADTMANNTFMSCDLQPIPAGKYSLSLRICNLTDDRCFGNARISEEARTITVESSVAEVAPISGSVGGGTLLTLGGYGFNPSSSSIEVTVGSGNCEVTAVNQDSISCITSSNLPDNATIVVTDGDAAIEVSETVRFEFTMDTTPTLDSIAPTSEQDGETVTLTGTLFGMDANNIQVTIGNVPCLLIAIIDDTTLTCQVGVNFAGTYGVELSITGVGDAIVSEDVKFTYTLLVTSISNTTGSIAGQNTITVTGAGFDPSDTVVTICGQICSATATIPSVREIECTVPPVSDNLDSVTQNVSCDVNVTSMGMLKMYKDQYTYQLDLTPRVTKINVTRGGTEGGTRLAITGSGFTANAKVTIAGSPCLLGTRADTLIECITERSGRTVRAKVMVEIEGKGFAVSNAEFWYVDLWGSVFTWGGESLPVEGDFVVIPRDQTIILDVKTPILSYLLIQGGELIFDTEKGDNEVELHTQGALITSGGRLEVGTHDEPFLSKTQIVLYGHVLSTEIPVYGAKTLALREGEIDFHGRPLNVTWSRLARTAEAGSSELYLKHHVEWDVGGKMVVASTSFSQRENEELEIASITAGDDGGSVITLTTPLEYKHISVEQEIDGRKIETRGEVGYLTRNIVVRGNINEEWIGEAMDCPREFRPGQFAVQSCFLGRFGAETLSDQFGSQIMIHAAEQNKGHVTARIEHIEVTHAGQAFRLGRYPIHFHLNGNVSGSYVRGCGIHHTFNRAVTMHAVDHLLVENNVAYNILGHAYFLEDGIEQFNIIQDNLGVFVRASSSLLNVDITPATFWVVNPNNILRRNAAAGGTHFGFWYRLPANPTGPSATSDLCPRKQRVLEFSDNSAHSFGWYGLWVFRTYSPSLSGECDDNTHGPSYYDRFFAWRNDRGIEFDKVGSLQIRDSVMLDNKLAGIEMTDLDSIWSEENGPLIKDTLIVGYSGISSEGFCTESGIKTPKSYYLTVSGVTFANFDRSGCYPIQACSHCKSMQGGFETRYKNIKYINAGDQITKWQWEHEHIHRDLDGTLTGSDGPKVLIPTNSLLDPSKCSDHAGSSNGGSSNGTKGSLCDGDLEFGRLAVFDPPSSLEFSPISIVNSFGNVTLPYVFKRLRGGPGYMTHLELNTTYNVVWLEGRTLANISYSSIISGFSPDDYIILEQEYQMSLDSTEVAGVSDATNASVLSDPATAVTGDFVLDDTNTLSYIIKGASVPNEERTSIFSTYRCFYLNCIPPTPPPPPTLPPPIPPGRPSVTMMWSNVSMWPNNTLPVEGQDVMIPEGTYVIIDVPSLPRLGKLTIKGGLEFFDNQDRILEANLILIEGGRLVAGYPDTPFRNNLRIILHGNNTSPEFRHEFGATTVGAKAIGVFGELILNSKPQTSTTWTLISETVNSGDTSVTLIDNVDWIEGDVIVVTSTSFNAFETEVFEIVTVEGGNVLNLNDSFKYTHLGVSNSIGSVQYSIRGEVGRLSRSIVIENGDPDTANEQAFGCRVLVSNIGNVRGSVQLQGVEFKGCGQLGFTDDFDPRYALVMVNTGRQTESYIRECSFHDGYNTAIGVYLTDNMEIMDNVIHSTVGPSMILTGSDHAVLRNLASLSQFIGTYRNRDEPNNALWTANYEIAGASRILFTHNHAAGGGKSGIHTDGEDCGEESSSTIRHNVAHSSLHCVHIGYRDGSSTECSKFVNTTSYSCYHYGFFSYSPSGIQLFDSTFTNNKAAIYVSVAGPPSLSHQLGTKSVLIQGVNIISASLEFSCSEDDNRPAIADHPRSHFVIQTPSNGHVGIVIPSFVSSASGFPKFPWHAIHSYPAINGMTSVRQVSFVNFGNRCLERYDAVLMTNPDAEDANHPLHLEGTVFETDGRFTLQGLKIIPEFKLFIHEPRRSRVNPADCVDMDCDGMKQILIKDLDGKFTERDSPRTLVGRSEFEWDGDRMRGLGDFRIPKTMLSYPNGSRIDVNNIYPQKGILKGNEFGTLECMYNSYWNLHECTNLDHQMLVMESLDEDTEQRRLSPIGLGSNGFIDLLNGPMDNGWCGGYTCQERISTFYAIVASGFTYTVGLTSTNPQNFGLHLLNAGDDQAIVVRVIYTNPQRLDVYINNDGEDVYVPPKNAKLMEDGNLMYKESNSSDQYKFNPIIGDPHGANYYDRSFKQLHVNIRGNSTYKIITTPVIMLSLTITVTVENFFAEEFLVRNLALLLNIPSNRIRVVNVVRETRRRRKRQAGTPAIETIDIEIGDPPTPVIETPAVSVNTSDNSTYMAMNTTNTVNTTETNTTDTDMLNFDRLSELTEMVAAIVQTGEILQGSNGTTVVSAAIEEPAPPPVDPTGGVRATPETGGLQPEDVGENDTVLTFFDKQQIDEAIAANESTDVFMLSIPSRLVTRRLSISGLIEGIPLSGSLGLIFGMLDNNGDLSENLGLKEPWRLEATILSGPTGGYLTDDVVELVGGEASFEGLVFSHPGMYTLKFAVSFPETADFSITVESIEVDVRSLSLQLYQQPQDGNTTFTLYPYPIVRLFGKEMHLRDHQWRNATWYVTAHILGGRGEFVRQQRVELIGGEAIFTNLKIPNSGAYQIEFEASTSPESPVNHLPGNITSESFTIFPRQFTRFDTIYNADYDTIIVGNTVEFIRAFENHFVSQYEGAEVYNTTVVRGSIIVSTFVTARSTNILLDIINKVASDPNDTLSFMFNGVRLIASSTVRDTSYPVYAEDRLVLILATTIPAGAIFLCGLLLICIVTVCKRQRKRREKSKAGSDFKESNVQYNMYDVTIKKPTSADSLSIESVNEYYLVPEESLGDDDVQTSSSTTPASQRKENYVISENVELEVSVVPGSFFSNPSAVEDETSNSDLSQTKEDLGTQL